MKKMLISLAAAAAMFITGCDDKPDAATVASYSNLIGASAGAVVKLAKVDQDAIDKINEILMIANKVTPSQGQTYTDAWTPTMNEYLAKLKEQGKIDDLKEALIRTGMSAAMTGLDRLFEVKPKWKEHSDVVTAAVKGFIAGFQSSICPSCIDPSARLKAPAVDQNEVKIIAERIGVKL